MHPLDNFQCYFRWGKNCIICAKGKCFPCMCQCDRPFMDMCVTIVFNKATNWWENIKRSHWIGLPTSINSYKMIFFCEFINIKRRKKILFKTKINSNQTKFHKNINQKLQLKFSQQFQSPLSITVNLMCSPPNDKNSAKIYLSLHLLHLHHHSSFQTNQRPFNRFRNAQPKGNLVARPFA